MCANVSFWHSGQQKLFYFIILQCLVIDILLEVKPSFIDHVSLLRQEPLLILVLSYLHYTRVLLQYKLFTTYCNNAPPTTFMVLPATQPTLHEGMQLQQRPSRGRTWATDGSTVGVILKNPRLDDVTSDCGRANNKVINL